MKQAGISVLPRYFLTHLSVEGFRGINNADSPLKMRFRSDAVNSVFADNGGGKSSIFDALNYAIFGVVPRLRELQAAEQPDNYYINKFHPENRAVIELEFTPDDNSGDAVQIRIERKQDGERLETSPSGYPDPGGFLVSLREEFCLLDYTTFNGFIESTPLVRGRTFSALLGLSRYSDRRQCLQSVSNTRSLNADLDFKSIKTAADNESENAKGYLHKMRTSYTALTGEEISDTADIGAFKKSAVDALGQVVLLKPHVDGKSLEEIDFAKIKETIKTEEGGSAREELSETVKAIATLAPIQKFDKNTIETEQEELKRLVAQRDELIEATRGSLLKDLYATAELVITAPNWDEDKLCPLCEQAVPFSISDHIGEQLKQYAGAEEVSVGTIELWAKSTWRKALDALEQAGALSVDESERVVPDVQPRLENATFGTSEVANLISRTDELFSELNSVVESLTSHRDELASKLPESLVQLTEQVEQARQFAEATQAYQAALQKEEKARARLALREAWKTYISNASAAFSGAEAALSKSRIDEIHTDYRTMFQRIMNVADVVPELKKAESQEDLHVQLSDFHGQHDLSAKALLSESFRNALAISIFLAAAAKHAGSPRFVVMDDVTSSFDSGHQFNVMELLRTALRYPAVENGLQFIILSHDTSLEKYFDRLSETDHWHHSKLQGLPPIGAVVHRNESAERLKMKIGDFLDAGQKETAEKLIRQYLEYKLQTIIRKLRIPVPIDFAMRDTTRMVTNCIDAITEAVNLHNDAGILIMDGQQVQDFKNTHVPAIVGNWVAHYETGLASGLSVPMLRSVVQSIDDLEECFKYEHINNGYTTRKWYRSLRQR